MMPYYYYYYYYYYFYYYFYYCYYLFEYICTKYNWDWAQIQKLKPPTPCSDIFNTESYYEVNRSMIITDQVLFYAHYDFHTSEFFSQPKEETLVFTIFVF